MARKRSLFFRRIQSFLKPWLLPFLSIAIAISIVIMPMGITSSVFSAVTPAAKTDLLRQGKVYYDSQQYANAVKILQQAVSAFKTQEDKLGQAIALSNLSLAYQELGQWQSAAEAIADGLKLLPTTSEKNISSESAYILAQALEVRGRLQLKQGQTQTALNTWQQAGNIYERLEDEAGAIRSQINQAQAMRGLGMYRQAEKMLIKTTHRLQNRSNSALKATALRSLGDTFRVTGNLERSRQLLEQGLAVAQATRLSVDEILLSLGNTARALDEPQAALKLYGQAVKNSASVATSIQGQLNQLSLLIERDSQAALPLAIKIQSQLKDLPPSRMAVYARINLAENLKRLRNIATDNFTYANISQILTKARQQAEKLNDTTAISYALGNLAETYAQSGRAQQAIAMTQEALYLAQAINAPDIAYRWQWQLGRLQKEEGKTTEAIAAYGEAVKSLQSLRSDLVAVNPDVRFNFRQEVEPIYRELVDLLLHPQGIRHQTSDIRQPQGDSEPDPEKLQQARSIFESLQIAELVNFFQEDCLTLKQVDFIDEKAAVIYTILLEDRLEVILSLPGKKLRQYTTPITSLQVSSVVEELQQNLILPYTSAEEILPSSQQLYDWLIKPARMALDESKVETLVFVLDEQLRSIPMSVLHDGRHYLIEKYGVALTLGLQLFNPQPLTQVPLKALTAGLTKARFGFEPLQYVGRELQQINSEIPSRSLVNKEFTSDNLERAIDSYPHPVVHIASHGQFSSRLEETFILAWDKRIYVNRLDSLLQKRQNRQNAIELLVLSACETATGDKRAVLGMAGVAVRSGARSTLASLWLIDDRSTALLMSHFYEELKTGITKGEALRRAQLALLQGDYQHPRFWAAFVLLGNWL